MESSSPQHHFVILWALIHKETNMFFDYGPPIEFRQFYAPEKIKSVSISPDCRLLSIDSVNGSIYVWDVDTGVMTARLTNQLPKIRTVEFTPSSSHIISGGEDGTLELWEFDPTIQQTTDTESFGLSAVQIYKGHAVCSIGLMIDTFPDVNVGFGLVSNNNS